MLIVSNIKINCEVLQYEVMFKMRLLSITLRSIQTAHYVLAENLNSLHALK